MPGPGIHTRQLITWHYDVLKHGGAVGTHQLDGGGEIVPEGALMLTGGYKLLRPFDSDGAATLTFGFEFDPTWISGTPAAFNTPTWDDTFGNMGPEFIDNPGGSHALATVAGAPLTDGAVLIYLEFIAPPPAGFIPAP